MLYNVVFNPYKHTKTVPKVCKQVKLHVNIDLGNSLSFCYKCYSFEKPLLISVKSTQKSETFCKVWNCMHFWSYLNYNYDCKLGLGESIFKLNFASFFLLPHRKSRLYQAKETHVATNVPHISRSYTSRTFGVRDIYELQILQAPNALLRY